MSSGNDFFTTAQGSIEQAMAFWPEPREKSEGDEAAELIERAEQNFGVDISARAECLGRITCVEGGQFILCLDSQGVKMDAGFSLKKSALVKIAGEQSIIYGIVTALSVPAPAHSDASGEVELAEVELVGEALSTGDGALFKKGIGDIPTLGDLVYLATGDDIALIEQGVSRQGLVVGEVMGTMPRQAYIHADRFLSSNTLICGKDPFGKAQALRILSAQISQEFPDKPIIILDNKGRFQKEVSEAPWLVQLEKGACPFWELPVDILVFMACGETVSPHMLAHLQPLVSAALDQSWTGRSREDYGLFLDKLCPLLEGEAQYLKAFEALLDNGAFQMFFTDDVVTLKERVSAPGLWVFDVSGLDVSAMRYFSTALFALFGSRDFAEQLPYVFIDEMDCLLGGLSPLMQNALLQKLSLFLRHQNLSQLGCSLFCQNLDVLPSEVLNRLDTVMAFRMNAPAAIEQLRQLDVDKRGTLLDMLPILGEGEALVFGDAIALSERCRIKMPD